MSGLVAPTNTASRRFADVVYDGAQTPNALHLLTKDFLIYRFRRRPNVMTKCPLWFVLT
jgi:hypothetical protein